MFCSRPECQTTAGCAHRGPQGQMCYFVNSLLDDGPCPHCLGTGRKIKGAISEPFAGLPPHLHPK